MWIYEKKLEFPVKITKPDARLAKIMIEQYGGADGELGCIPAVSQPEIYDGNAGGKGNAE